MPPKIQRPDLGGPFPEHIAIIMDGNGRWAGERGMRRIFGHRAGIDSVREITTECATMGVKSLTLYSFSVENWKRPRSEIRYLMRLLRKFLVDERPTLRENDGRLSAIGRIDDLPQDAQDELARTAWAATSRSWYKTRGGKITNNWSGTTTRYWWRTRRPDFSRYTAA